MPIPRLAKGKDKEKSSDGQIDGEFHRIALYFNSLSAVHEWQRAIALIGILIRAVWLSYRPIHYPPQVQNYGY